MREHMREDLVRLEIVGLKRPQTQLCSEVMFFIKHQLCYKYQHIDDDKVFDNGWKTVIPGVSEITHTIKLAAKITHRRKNKSFKKK